MDCTIRDGGLMNNHLFDDEVVKGVYTACVEGGIDYMEIGYINSKRIFSPSENGAWKFCSEDDIRRIVSENDTSLKLSVMADAEKCDYHTDILPCDQSVLGMIRVASYIHQIPLALDPDAALAVDADMQAQDHCAVDPEAEPALEASSEADL